MNHAEQPLFLLEDATVRQECRCLPILHPKPEPPSNPLDNQKFMQPIMQVLDRCPEIRPIFLKALRQHLGSPA